MEPNVDTGRRARRAACRAAGQKWDGTWMLFDVPNPNGNRKHRRFGRWVWRRELGL